jgi:hypothetical protein
MLLPRLPFRCSHRGSFTGNCSPNQYTYTNNQNSLNMPKGGCTCGNIRVEYDGEPSAKVCTTRSKSSLCCISCTDKPIIQALCHCADCKKMSGSAYSTNVIVPNTGFQITSGTPKTWTKKADSGAEVTTSFCGECGTNLWRQTSTFGENRVVKVGILDNLSDLNDAKPDVELYAPERASWLEPTAGAKQLKGMPGSEEV